METDENITQINNKEFAHISDAELEILMDWKNTPSFQVLTKLLKGKSMSMIDMVTRKLQLDKDMKAKWACSTATASLLADEHLSAKYNEMLQVLLVSERAVKAKADRVKAADASLKQAPKPRTVNPITGY